MGVSSENYADTLESETSHFLTKLINNQVTTPTIKKDKEEILKIEK